MSPGSLNPDGAQATAGHRGVALNPDVRSVTSHRQSSGKSWVKRSDLLFGQLPHANTPTDVSPGAGRAAGGWSSTHSTGRRQEEIRSSQETN
ncbi:hypothetical protein EYF80_066103 [Liparis tanakae]|uniref:Uncharacterized protein n=1 Tax=Liparis tanakae TaxID=230148 RepID=A0A4Z2E4N2_9TELE|nr:hypothetical protein EYF80_066103 [Liparis tanakae]